MSIKMTDGKNNNRPIALDKTAIAQLRLAFDSARNLGVRPDCSQTSLTFPSRTTTSAEPLRPSSAAVHENFLSSSAEFEPEEKENLPYRSPRNCFKASSAIFRSLASVSGDTV